MKRNSQKMKKKQRKGRRNQSDQSTSVRSDDSGGRFRRPIPSAAGIFADRAAVGFVAIDRRMDRPFLYDSFT